MGFRSLIFPEQDFCSMPFLYFCTTFFFELFHYIPFLLWQYSEQILHGHSKEIVAMTFSHAFS
jgi:hypothetical protein